MSASKNLYELVAAIEANAKAFYKKGNKAAGTRLRKVLQDIKVLAQQERSEMTSKKNTKILLIFYDILK